MEWFWKSRVHPPAVPFCPTPSLAVPHRPHNPADSTRRKISREMVMRKSRWVKLLMEAGGGERGGRDDNNTNNKKAKKTIIILKLRCYHIQFSEYANGENFLLFLSIFSALKLAFCWLLLLSLSSSTISRRLRFVIYCWIICYVTLAHTKTPGVQQKSIQRTLRYFNTVSSVSSAARWYRIKLEIALGSYLERFPSANAAQCREAHRSSPQGIVISPPDHCSCVFECVSASSGCGCHQRHDRIFVMAAVWLFLPPFCHTQTMNQMK